MEIFGFVIERKHGAPVGSHRKAILNLQARLAKVEQQVGVKSATVDKESRDQEEIERILAQADDAIVQKDDLLWGTD